jgi:hypothetical protein
MLITLGILLAVQSVLLIVLCNKNNKYKTELKDLIIKNETLEVHKEALERYVEAINPPLDSDHGIKDSLSILKDRLADIQWVMQDQYESTYSDFIKFTQSSAYQLHNYHDAVVIGLREGLIIKKKEMSNEQGQETETSGSPGSAETTSIRLVANKQT